jgi:hypothetical protein
MLATPTGSSLHIRTDSQAAAAVLTKIHTVGTIHHLEDLDVWKVIYHETFRIHVTVEWIKGHAGDYGNELADKAANEGRRLALRANHRSPLERHLSRAQFPETRPCILDCPPTDAELRRAISKLRMYKHPGPNGVSPMAFRAIRDDDDDPAKFRAFADFYRRCFVLGRVPLCFLDGVMALLPKGPKPSADPAQMRGITVIPTFAKVLSNVISERLLSVPLHPAQHGFVRQMSTLHAVVELKQRIRRARRTGQRLIAVYLDVAKAYDSIDRSAIAYALART